MALVFSNFGKSVCRGKSIPVNTSLYNKIKGEVKRKVKRWPSAYASGQLVRTYKQRGGKYSCSGNSFGKLRQWFKEDWRDACTGLPCGRKAGSNRRYPYCRPSRRISGSTPQTIRELSRETIKKRCAKKHRIKGETLRFGTSKKELYKDYRYCTSKKSRFGARGETMQSYLNEIEKNRRKRNITREDFLRRSELAGARYNSKQKDLNKIYEELYGNNEPSQRTLSDLNVSARPFKPKQMFQFNPETQS